MKIGIYETVHLDWVLPLCELFNEQSHEVSFFTSASFKKDIQEAVPDAYAKYKWIYLNEQENRQSFISKTKGFFQSDSFDLILLNSVDSRHLFIYYLLRKSPAYVLVNLHDINNFFRSRLSLNLRKMVRTIGKRLLRNRANGYLVNFEEMQQYVAQHQLTSKPVYQLSPVFSKAKAPTLSHGSPTVVVPGSIDKRRRDYELVLRAWENANLQKVQLILAGRPVGKYGNTILKKVKILLEKGFTIRFFENEVPENVFQELIANAAILVSPLVIQTSIHDNINEEYGKSKFSGNVYDAIRHGKPLIIPQTLQVPHTIETSCIRFKNEAELIQAFYSVFNFYNSLLKELSATAFRNSLYYSKENALRKFTTILENIANKNS